MRKVHCVGSSVIRCVGCNLLGALWISVITFLCYVLLYGCP